jgi:hypothetical protein
MAALVRWRSPPALPSENLGSSERPRAARARRSASAARRSARRAFASRPPAPPRSLLAALAAAGASPVRHPAPAGPLWLRGTEKGGPDCPVFLTLPNYTSKLSGQGSPSHREPRYGRSGSLSRDSPSAGRPPLTEIHSGQKEAGHRWNGEPCPPACARSARRSTPAPRKEKRTRSAGVPRLLSAPGRHRFSL